MKIKGPGSKGQELTMQSETSFNIKTEEPKKTLKSYQPPFTKADSNSSQQHSEKASHKQTKNTDSSLDSPKEKQEENNQMKEEEQEKKRKLEEIIRVREEQEKKRKLEEIIRVREEQEKRETELLRKKQSVQMKQQAKNKQKQSKTREDKLHSQLQSPTNKSQLQLLLQQFIESESQWCVLNQKYDNLQSRHKQQQSLLDSLRTSLTAAELQQQRMISAQDYDQAQHLQQLIQQLRERCTRTQSSMRQLGQETSQMEYDEMVLLKGEVGRQRKVSRRIKLVEMGIREEMRNVQRGESERMEVERGKEEGERKKAMRVEIEVKLQREQLEMYEKTYQEDMGEKRDPLMKSKGVLVEKREILVAEIEEMQRLLKQKRVELNGVDRGIGEIERQVEQIEDSFREEGSNIEERRRKLRQLEMEKEGIERGLQKQREMISDMMACLEDKMKKKERDCVQLSVLGKWLEEKSSVKEELLETRKVKLDSMLCLCRNLTQIKVDVQELKHTIERKQRESKRVEAEITKCDLKRNQLKKRLPVLEMEQQSLVLSKNFKGAAVKKNQAKEIGEQMESIKNRIDNYIQEEQNIIKEIQQLREKQNKIREEENKLKQNIEMRKIAILNDKIICLTMLKEEAKIISNVEKQQYFQKIIQRIKKEIKVLNRQEIIQKTQQRQKQEQEQTKDQSSRVMQEKQKEEPMQQQSVQEQDGYVAMS